MDERITKERAISHPLEEVFDIPEETTLVTYAESVPGELIVIPDYDKKDIEIENQLENIYIKALDAFSAQQDITETVEGKHASQSGEVAVQFLNTALAAVKEKSIQKQQKDKLVVGAMKNTPKTTNNLNIITADRNDILRIIADKAQRKEE
jgi:hypothetical protein